MVWEMMSLISLIFRLPVLSVSLLRLDFSFREAPETVCAHSSNSRALTSGFYVDVNIRLDALGEAVKTKTVLTDDAADMIICILRYFCI